MSDLEQLRRQLRDGKRLQPNRDPAVASARPVSRPPGPAPARPRSGAPFAVLTQLGLACALVLLLLVGLMSLPTLGGSIHRSTDPAPINAASAPPASPAPFPVAPVHRPSRVPPSDSPSDEQRSERQLEQKTAQEPESDSEQAPAETAVRQHSETPRENDYPASAQRNSEARLATPPRLLVRPRFPSLPRSLVATFADRRFTVVVEITAEGEPRNPRLLGNHEKIPDWFRESLLRSVLQSRWAPALDDRGRPILSAATVVFAP